MTLILELDPDLEEQLRNRAIEREIPVEEFALSALADAVKVEATGDRILRYAASARRLTPDEEWDRLPADISKNLDHYLYGHPRREE